MTGSTVARLSLLFPLFAVALAAQAPIPQPTSVVAIRNTTVVLAASGSTLRETTVVVRGDRIAAVGPTDAVAIPRGARVVDGTGRFLIPGLVDMHAHLSKLRASAMGLFVAHGVTTVRDMGGDYDELRQWRADVTAGQRTGPRILMAGPILESVANIERMRKDPPSERVEPFERMRIGVGSPDEARAVVAKLAALEVDFLKVRTVQDRETYLALNEAANAHNLRLVGHVPPGTAQFILEAGQDGIEHGFGRAFDKETREERLAVWRRYAAAGVPIAPTLVTLEALLAPLDRLRAIVDDETGALEPRRRYLSRFLILDWREQLLEQSAQSQQQLRGLLEQRSRDLREMHEAGMDILAATDTGVLNLYPGSSLHEELALLVKHVSMTPAEALERATRRSARWLRLGDSIGTIERGKVADLVLLDADPLLDITNTRRIAAVVLRGQFYDRPGLERIRARVLTAPDIKADDWGRMKAKAATRTPRP
jgi:imidazolonepropionase-like amidohydrolase